VVAAGHLLAGPSRRRRIQQIAPLVAAEPSLVAAEPSLVAAEPSLVAAEPSLVAAEPSLVAGGDAAAR